jgi:hypothetical protein
MAKRKRSRPHTGSWAYAYEIVPPQTYDRLRTIKTLLDHENTGGGQDGAQTWVGRLVHERQVTHILVVSGGPEQDREVNHRLEAALQVLHVGFSLTAPLAVADDAAPSPVTECLIPSCD